MKVPFMLPLGHFTEQLGGTERQPAQEGGDTHTPTPVERAWGQQDGSALHTLPKSERLLRELQAVGIQSQHTKKKKKIRSNKMGTWEKWEGADMVPCGKGPPPCT